MEDGFSQLDKTSSDSEFSLPDDASLCFPTVVPQLAFRHPP